MNYWLLKSEPDAYSWQKLVADGSGHWDGVRNFQAARNLRAMAVGDRAFFYHSNIGLEIVGVMEITRAAYPDLSAEKKGPWVMVDVKPIAPFKTPITLKQIKADPQFADFELVRRARLSVMPVPPAHWRTICKMGGVQP